MKLLEAVALAGLLIGGATSFVPLPNSAHAEDVWIIHADVTKQNGDTGGFFLNGARFTDLEHCTKVITDKDFIAMTRDALTDNPDDKVELTCKTLDDVLHPKQPI